MPPEISVLEIAVLGFRLSGSASALREKQWFDRVRRLNAWQAWQRLETIKLLLEKGAKIKGYMAVALQAVLRDASKHSSEAEYAKLLLGFASWKSVFKDLDTMRSVSFPNDKVQEAHEEGLFPEYKIYS